MKVTSSLTVNALVTALLLSAAASVALQREPLAVALAATPLLAWLTLKVVPSVSRVDRAVRDVSVVWILLMCSTLVWRVRTTQSLDANPLDSAAVVRVLLVGVAGVLAIALVGHTMTRRVPRAVQLLAVYAAVAAFTSLISPEPAQALYRACELTVGLLAILLAVSRLGAQAGAVLIKVVVFGFGLMLAVIWMEAVVIPSQAWVRTINYSVTPYTLEGYIPAFSSNTVGLMGAVVGVWGLTRVLSSPSARWIGVLALAGGMATVVAAQYRTGIIGFLLAAGIVLLDRARTRVLVAAVAICLVVVFVGAKPATESAMRIFEKGQPGSVENLDSRTTYWGAAIPAIKQRPLTGWGLNVGSREVLGKIGLDDATTVHSAWFEALLGTGLIGAAALAGAYAFGLRDAWRGRHDPAGLAALGILIVLLVRSFTGGAGELFDLPYLVLGAAVLAAATAADGSPDSASAET